MKGKVHGVGVVYSVEVAVEEVAVVVVAAGSAIALQVRWNPLRVTEPSVSKLISTLGSIFLLFLQ